MVDKQKVDKIHTSKEEWAVGWMDGERYVQAWCYWMNSLGIMANKHETMFTLGTLGMLTLGMLTLGMIQIV